MGGTNEIEPQKVSMSPAGRRPNSVYVCVASERPNTNNRTSRCLERSLLYLMNVPAPSGNRKPSLAAMGADQRLVHAAAILLWCTCAVAGAQADFEEWLHCRGISCRVATLRDQQAMWDRCPRPDQR